VEMVKGEFLGRRKKRKLWKARLNLAGKCKPSLKRVEIIHHFRRKPWREEINWET
jgi:hypothetical protein